MDHLEERNAYLRTVVYIRNRNDNERYMHYSIALSDSIGRQDGVLILDGTDLEMGYKRSLQKINEVFHDLWKIPINHRLCVNAKKIAYEYFKTISSFGFELNPK